MLIPFHYGTAKTPTISSVAQDLADPLGGSSHVITGTNFTGVSAASDVKFGAVNATSYVVNSATQITAVAPAQAAGTFNVTVTRYGKVSNGVSFESWSPIVPATPTLFLEKPDYSVTAGTGTWVPRAHWHVQNYVEATNPPTATGGAPVFTRAGNHLLPDGDTWSDLIGLSHTQDATIWGVYDITSLPAGGSYDFMWADDDGAGAVKSGLYLGSTGTLEWLHWNGAATYATLGAGSAAVGRIVIIAKRTANGANCLVKISADGGVSYSTALAFSDLQSSSGTVRIGRTPSVGGGIYKLAATCHTFGTVKSLWSTGDDTKFRKWAAARHP